MMDTAVIEHKDGSFSWKRLKVWKHILLDKFVKLKRIIGARDDMGSKVAIDSHSGKKRITVTTHKNIFEFGTLSRWSETISTCIAKFVLACFIKTDKLRPIPLHTRIALHLSPLRPQFFISLKCNLVKKIPSKSSLLEILV